MLHHRASTSPSVPVAASAARVVSPSPSADADIGNRSANRMGGYELHARRIAGDPGSDEVQDQPRRAVAEIAERGHVRGVRHLDVRRVREAVGRHLRAFGRGQRIQIPVQHQHGDVGIRRARGLRGDVLRGNRPSDARREQRRRRDDPVVDRERGERIRIDRDGGRRALLGTARRGPASRRRDPTAAGSRCSPWPSRALPSTCGCSRRRPRTRSRPPAEGAAPGRDGSLASRHGRRPRARGRSSASWLPT